ncbi:MAG: hypothetical protein A2Y38_26105 [Spirochaetes bacterium GWB1_59_5]|nr:MAG: hypothetical protein A2Y38_26105 [Spirochaetes bacterium GWB1_59_5]
MTRRYPHEVDALLRKPIGTEKLVDMLADWAREAMRQRDELVERTGRAIADRARAEDEAQSYVRSVIDAAERAGYRVDHERAQDSLDNARYQTARDAFEIAKLERFRRSMCTVPLDVADARRKGVDDSAILDAVVKVADRAHAAYKSASAPTFDEWLSQCKSRDEDSGTLFDVA